MPSRKAKRATSKKRSLRSQPTLSPILRSAFEVLEHGLYHFFRSDTTTDMKFALLHVDQAIELLLKEKVREGGISIYKSKNPKETITIWGAFEILTSELGCKIPERPNLELLHEERNNIQHKYANPSFDDARFHLDHALKFIKRFLKDELKIDLASYLPSEFIDQLGL